MIKNKKGFLEKIFIPIFLFLLVSSFFTFVLMLTQEGVGDPLIGEFADQAIAIAGNNQQVINNTNELRADYELAKFNYDYIFIVMFILLELGLIELAFKSPKLPAWNYLTWLFFGTVFLSFGYSWIMDTSGWFINQYIFGGLFPADVTYLPFFSWFIEWELVIFIFNIVMVLAVNQIFGKQGIVDVNPILGGKA